MVYYTTRMRTGPTLGSVAIPLLALLLGCGADDEVAPLLAVEPAALDFGTVAVGVSATADVVVRNDGGGAIEVLSVSVVEGDAGAWSLARPSFEALGPGAELVLSVTFSPEEEGDASARVQVRTDAPGAETTYVVATGSGGPSTADDDADGFSPADGDCDDGRAEVFPGADELCDGRDDDCDGDVPADEADADADGWRLCDADCDDADGAVYPGAPEVCDDKDDDCDGATPDRLDADGDGYDICAGDCDDGDGLAIPGGTEVCDGADNDCSGEADDLDADGDGFSACDPIRDCDDADAGAHPVYVDDDGSENATGTYADPFATFDAALAALDDTCQSVGVLPGTYEAAVPWVGAFDEDTLEVRGLGADPGEVVLTPPAGERAFSIVDGGLLELGNMTLTGATNAEGDGGAIYADAAYVYLSDVVLSGNSTAGDGGAIAVNAGLLHLGGACVLQDNVAGDDGGAVAVVSGGMEDEGETLYTGNAGRLGGAVLLQSSDVQLVGAVFDGNAAAQDGGAVYADASTSLRVERLTVVRNTAVGRGGGLALNDPGDAYGYVRNLVVEDNAAVDGSGIAVLGAAAAGALHNNTLASNDGGDALLVDVTDAAALYVWANVLAFNDGTAALGCSGGASVAYNLAYGTDSGTDLDLVGCVDGGENLVDDPLFSAFDDDGDPDDDDLSLRPTSPAVDSGPEDGAGPGHVTWSDPDGTRNDRGHTGGPGGS